MGGGGISLNPDATFGPGNISAIGAAVTHESCSADNRGEIRLRVLTETGGGSELVSVDALCLCTRKVVDFFGTSTTYHWSCFTSQAVF
jgi:hypothetical protein